MTKEEKPEKVCLFDLDGTLCDYETALFKGMEALRSPGEDPCKVFELDNAPEYLRNRANLIRASAEWWAGLPKYKLGFDVWEMAGEIGFRRMVLTAGPKRNPNAWAGKKMWMDENLGQDVDITITRDKGLVYGRILVDDWPDYIKRWLKWRPRGLVIMPAGDANRNFRHPQVIRYVGDNMREVFVAMHNAFRRGE